MPSNRSNRIGKPLIRGVILAGFVLTAPQGALADGNDFLQQGANHFDAGEFEHAIEDYTRAIESGDLTSADLVGAIYDRGLSKDRLQRNDAALADFKAAISIDPRHIASLSSVCFQYSVRKQYDTAEPYCDRALAIEPDNAPSLATRGLVRAGQGNFADAIADLSTAIDLQPGNFGHRINRAKVYIDMSRIGDARRDLTHVRDTAPAWVQTHPVYLTLAKKAGM